MQLAKTHQSLQNNMLDIGPAICDPYASSLLYTTCKYTLFFSIYCFSFLEEFLSLSS